jgi:hypothetical protein
MLWKKLQRTFIIIFFLLIPAWNVFSSYEDIDSNSIKAFDNFYKEVNKFSKKDDGLQYLYYLRNALSILSNSDKINSKNYKQFSDLQKLNNEKIFELEYNLIIDSNKTKLNNLSYLKDFKIISYNEDLIFEENWIWYAYLFDERKYTQDYLNLRKEYLLQNWFRENQTLVFFSNEEKSINFVQNYRKVKLIKDSVIFWFPDKYDLLKTLKGNKEKHPYNDDDNDFLNLEKVSIEITKQVYKDENKIAIIYDYILKNLQYPETIDFDDYKLFSWIEAFKWKITVCEWYVELFNLMLWFNDISSQVFIWDVITATDYPKISHAWVKIGDYYYDPTFDDPIWTKETKTKDKYLFFKIPKDLFYTDRFDYLDSPEELKTTSFEYRENLVKANLIAIFPKYKNSNYKTLAPYNFRNKYGIPLNSEISINDLKKIMQYWELNEAKLNINWQIKNVKTMLYKTITDDNIIEKLLESYDYNINWLYLIYWVKSWQPAQYIVVKNTEIEFY